MHNEVAAYESMQDAEVKLDVTFARSKRRGESQT